MSFATDQESYCVIHHQAEVMEARSVICFECGHVYRNKADVIKVDHDEWGELATDGFPECCPYCVHDWQ